MKRAILLWLTLLCVIGPQALIDQENSSNSSIGPIYLAILDDDREKLGQMQPGSTPKRLIMPAFENRDGEWLAIRLFEADSMAWTIAFDGKNLGTIESKRTSEDADQINSDMSRAKQEITTPANRVPNLAGSSREFLGSQGLVGLRQVGRPLVAISKPNYKDPDIWKRAQIPMDYRKSVIAEFRKMYPVLDRCENEQIIERGWNYPHSAFSFPVSYKSKSSAFLAALRLNAGECGWGGKQDDPIDSFVYQWFLVSADHKVKRIGGFGSLLDAGDYDNDGHSELVFFSTLTEHSDVYSLVFDNLSRQVQLEVGYR